MTPTQAAYAAGAEAMREAIVSALGPLTLGGATMVGRNNIGTALDVARSLPIPPMPSPAVPEPVVGMRYRRTSYRDDQWRQIENVTATVITHRYHSSGEATGYVSTTKRAAWSKAIAAGRLEMLP